MNVITSNIRMDFVRPENTPLVYAVQGERLTRRVELELYHDGEPWTIPETVIPAIRYGRIDLTGGYYDTLPDGTPACSCSGNTLTILLAPQMMSAAGAVLVQAELLQEDAMLATFAFQLMVAMNPAEGIVTPENYVNWAAWMRQQLKEQTNEILETGDFTGPPGPAGAPASVSSYDVTYQEASSAVIVPTGTWSHTIPHVPGGQFLWTRTTLTFNDDTPVTFYSVARMGMDGAGSVSSVANISPDSNGNVPLTAENIGALPHTGGDLIGELKMNGQPISGLNLPTQSDHAANMAYVNQQAKNAAPWNLLDNSDFAHPVNQRGNATTTGSGYGIDRWASSGGSGVVDIKSGYVNIRSKDGTGAYISQYLEPGKIRDGKTYTFVCEFLDGSVRFRSGEASPSMSEIAMWFDTNAVRLGYDSSEQSYYVMFSTTSTTGINVVNIALYEGEYTADTLPKYHPKGYAAELQECRRYYQRINPGYIPFGFGWSNNTTPAAIRVTFPCSPMRIKPTVTFSGTLNNVRMQFNQGTVNVTSVDGVQYSPEAEYMAIFMKPNTVYAGPFVAYCVSGYEAFELSADL